MNLTILRFIWVFLSLLFMHQAFCTVEKTPRPKDSSVCSRLHLDRLFQHKELVDKKLLTSINLVTNDKTIGHSAKANRLQVINAFQREMNDSVVSIYNSAENLKSFLKGDYRSIQQLKETSKNRLEQLKSLMLQAEDELNQIIEAEKEEQAELKKNKQNSRKSNVIKKFVYNLIGDVAVAADELEGKLDYDEFEQKIHSAEEIHIETVIRVGGEEEKAVNDNEGVVMLVDSESNHFVLSKPKDSTITHIDHVLLKEIIFITIIAFVFILLCNLLNLPSIFACILTGILLGPSGHGYLKNLVQIETFGEFGVFFIFFAVGMEFSPVKLKKVLRISLTGTVSIFTLYILIGLFWGSIFGIPLSQSFFVTLALSFSSTPLIVKLHDIYKDKRDISNSTDTGDDYFTLLISMMFLQDIGLGLFMAVLPILAGHSPQKSHSFVKVPGNAALHTLFHGTFEGLWEELFFTAVELCFVLLGILALALVLSKYVATKYFRTLSMFGSHECHVLGILSAIFGMLMVTEAVGISMELGCFICGGIIGTTGEQTTKNVLSVVEPFKDFFSILFFASIGFHIFPSFVLSEIAIFIPITALVILTKFFITSTVLHQLLPKGNKSKWLVASGLSQLSEFSFVLGSRARRYGLIGREVYLTILSVTTLSLLIAPFIWRSVHSTVLHGNAFSIKTIMKKLKTVPL